MEWNIVVAYLVLFGAGFLVGLFNAPRFPTITLCCFATLVSAQLLKFQPAASVTFARSFLLWILAVFVFLYVGLFCGEVIRKMLRRERAS